MRRKLVAGNWKMNGSIPFVDSFSQELMAEMGGDETSDVALFVPSLFLCSASEMFSGSRIVVGAQNVSEHNDGAYTGEVSASMLSGVGCCWVLIGHSERRSLFSESDSDVLRKTTAALNNGLNVILCVGETLEERESGEVAAVITRQVDAVLSELSLDVLCNITIAYEPVWAIGTGKTASPDQAQEVHSLIRDVVAKKSASLSESMRILYGGSVKPDNAVEIFSKPDVDGGLIGGASLSSADFAAIIKAAS